MNNHFSGFAGQILSNSRNTPKMIKGRLAKISNMCFKRHSVIEDNTKIGGAFHWNNIDIPDTEK